MGLGKQETPFLVVPRASRSKGISGGTSSLLVELLMHDRHNPLFSVCCSKSYAYHLVLCGRLGCSCNGLLEHWGLDISLLLYYSLGYIFF
jgi:hypothetical protein